MQFNYEHPILGTVNVDTKAKTIGYSNIKYLDVTALGQNGKLLASLDLPIESTTDFIKSKINQYIKE